jgi:hypothetical protein
MQAMHAWATCIGTVTPRNRDQYHAKVGGWKLTHALTTRFRNDGSTLCRLGLTGRRCGWGEELLEDGV